MAVATRSLLPIVALSTVVLASTGHDVFPRKAHSHPNRIPNHNFERHLEERALPGNWSTIGCYSDAVAKRSLKGATFADPTGMTNEACVNFCADAGWALAGTEYSVECFCDNWLSSSAVEYDITECGFSCSGDDGQTCGGDGRLLVHYSGVDPGPPPPPPAELEAFDLWESRGCYTDTGARRTLLTPLPVPSATPQKCAEACLSQPAPLRYSGVEYGAECWCGHVLSNDGAPAEDQTSCSMACAGNSTWLCGGPDRLNIYEYTGDLPEPPPPPSELEVYGLWESLGCWTDNGADRTLVVPFGVPGSVVTCMDTCYDAGYPLSGSEYGGECYCALELSEAAQSVDDGCTMACAQNATLLCGGANRINVYNYTSTLPHPPQDPGVPGGGPPPPPLADLPEPWQYSGCWVDNTFGRILVYQGLPPSEDMDIGTCIAFCDSAGYPLAGLQYAQECYCGKTVINAGFESTKGDQDCYMTCAGDDEHACGGPNRFSLYSKTEDITVIPVPVTKTDNLPGAFQYSGCYAEPGAERVFPYMIYDPIGTTIETCLERCSLFGYAAAGLEYSSECWCGDFEQIEDNGGWLAPDEDCSMPCVGSPEYHCGGVQRLSMYTWTSPPLYEWHRPVNTGRYELLIGGIVIPLIATLGVNNKVSFMEKYGTGAWNSTGAYELDHSIADNYLLAWREMHVKSDVFCAGNLVLPDKSGRQISLGGWSFESTEGIRFYTPDGSPGVNGTNDWEEQWNDIHLQQGRWYPTPMIMANGSILVVGGEEGSNGLPVPTLEVLPKAEGGPTWLYMDWLERTDPNNLYPFLTVLPTGGIFVIYHNEARILDEVTFETIKEYPIIPGSVTGGGGRTYPLEGTAVLLPQYAPYSDPLEVLTCGGSNFGFALDNCVLISPEVEDPQWIIERMPSRRVMTNISPLPDGTYLIVGGAHQGVAGFGLANSPNLEAVLYDPTQPLHHRMSVLNVTTVARMYHSEAILLNDARVLITGSDPQDAGAHPQEYRMEVYYPPYLTDGRKQPEFAITETDWAYGGSYTVDITLHQDGPVRFSLLAAVSATHGNSMGQRTIFPEFACSGTTCTIVAPPNSHISPPGWHQLFLLDGPTPSFSAWVRIGGDPGQLGLWPDFPGFTLPGI